jgi:tetratricopeptide (TPR) repeat protein
MNHRGSRASSAPGIEGPFSRQSITHSNHRRSHPLALILRHDWVSLGASFDKTNALCQLQAAFVLGDLAAKRASRITTLAAVQAEAPEFACVGQLELALDGTLDVDHQQAMRRSIELSQGDPVERDALCMLARIYAFARGEEHAPIGDRTADDAAIFQRLEHLLERVELRDEPQKLALLYQELSEQHASAVWKRAYRLRASELFIVAGEYKVAEALLDFGFDNPVLVQLACFYQLVCCCARRDWSRLISLLPGLGERQKDPNLALLATQVLALIAHKAFAASEQSLAEQAQEASQETASAEAIRESFELVQQAIAQANGQPKETAVGFAALSVGFMLSFSKAESAKATDSLPEQERELFEFARALAQLERRPIETYRLLADVERQSAPLAVRALAAIKARKWSDAVDSLQTLAEGLPPDIASLLLREAAHISVVDAKQVDTGLLLIERALELNPHDHQLRLEAAAIQLRKGRQSGAIAHLEHAAEVHAKAGDVSSAADYLTTAAVIARHQLAEPQRAEELYEKALALDALHHAALVGIRELLSGQQRQKELTTHVESLLELATDPDQQATLRGELCVAYQARWQQSQSAEDLAACLEACEQTLALDPAHPAATNTLVAVCQENSDWQGLCQRLDPERCNRDGARALVRALQRLQKWPELAQLNRRLAELTPGKHEKLAAALLAGDIYRDRLSDVSMAEASYRWAYEQTGERRALRRLASLLRAHQSKAQLLTVLEEDLALPGIDDEAALRIELANLYELLGDQNSAIVHYQAVLEQSNAAIDEQALCALERLLRAAGRHADLARLLERLRARRSGRDDGIVILLALGRVYGDLSDEQAALRMVTQLQREIPNNTQVFEFAEEIYQKQSRYRELCELYERWIGHLEGKGQDDEITILLQRKGTIELSKLGVTSQAVESLSRVVELRPTDPEPLKLLERVLSESRDWRALISVYERQANALDDPRGQLHALHQAAEIAAERAGDEAEAQRLYQRILALDPSDARSFAFLEDNLEHMQDSRQLAELLLQRAGQVANPPEAAEFIMRAASVYEQLGDVAQAKRQYERALELDEDLRLALQALARIHESEESWRNFVTVTRRLIRSEKDPATKGLLYFKCGSVIETQFNHAEEAERYYIKAIRTSPKCLPAIHSLRELYDRQQKWEKVVKTLTMEAKLWSDEKGRSDVLAKIAEIYAVKLRDQVQALKYYQRALETYPENMPAALALFELSANRGNLNEAVAWGEIYAKRVQRRGSQVQRADFFVPWAQVLRKVGRFKEAAEILVNALALRPNDEQALLGLLDVCHESPDAYDFASAVNELSRNHYDSPATDAILTTVMGVLAQRRSEVDQAISLYQKALQLGEYSVRLARPYADLLVRLGDNEEAVSLMNRCQAQASERLAIGDWLDAAIWLVDHKMIWEGNITEAIAICQQALDEQPNSVEVRTRLGKLYQLLNRPDLAVGEHQNLCRQAESRGQEAITQARHYHTLGLAADKSRKGELAIESWRHATEICPEYPYPFISLALQALQSGNFGTAEKWLFAAQQGAGAQHPDVQRALAHVSIRKGEVQAGLAILDQLSSGDSCDAKLDTLLLARQLARLGQTDQAKRALLELINEQCDYVPALHELKAVWQQAGQLDRASRVEQVLRLTEGPSSPSAPNPAPLAHPIGAASWTKLAADVRQLPIESLWQAISRSAGRIIQSEAPKTSPELIDPKLGSALADVCRLFRTQAQIFELSNEHESVWLLEGQRLYINTSTLALPTEDLRFVISLGLTIMRSGHEPLYRIGPPARLDLARLLASSFVRQGPMPDLIQHLIADLPRREQKLLAKTIASHPIESEEVDELAQTWITALESLCIRTAMVVVDDIGPLVKLLALKANVGIDAVLDGRGLLTTLPHFREIVDYYLSDLFHETRLGVVAERA